MEKKKYTNLERLFDACGSAYESHLSPAFLHVFIVAAIGFFPSHSVIEALSVSQKYKKESAYFVTASQTWALYQSGNGTGL